MNFISDNDQIDFFLLNDQKNNENNYWNVARTFDSTRGFDGISHKTNDLELFRFVMICKFALIF